MANWVLGFELNSEPYTVELGTKHILYTSKECSSLRVLPEQRSEDTQIETLIARIGQFPLPFQARTKLTVELLQSVRLIGVTLIIQFQRSE
jgi:hypothetical protein